MIPETQDGSLFSRTKILFTGMMGCGKSTTARTLGSQLDIPVFDLDDRIEQTSGLNIPEFFAAYGESAFRELEHQCLEEVLDWPGRALVALGGGAICQEMNRAIIKPPNITVYLRCDIDLLVTRLSSASEQRPLLSVRDQDIRQRILGLLSSRQIWYEQADHVVDVQSDNSHLQELTDWIRHKVYP